MDNKIRSVFISDLHLGSYGCQHEYLIKFLKSFKCETLYLNGDIIDLWALRRNGCYLPQEHINVVRKILSIAKSGTKIKYVLGNHEDHFRKYHDFSHPLIFGNIEIANEFVHEMVNGEKMWVIHGDLYDSLVKNYRWVAILGDISYTILLFVNNIFNKIRTKFGFNYWSLSKAIKEKVKKSVAYICEYEKLLAQECEKRGYSYVNCGHIHVSAIKKIGNVNYLNSGDFLENMTAIFEHYDGKIELIIFRDI